jgi:hypothetical protein
MTVEFLDEPVDTGRPDGRGPSHPVLRLVVALLLIAGVTAWVVARETPAASTVSAQADPRCRGIPDCAVHAGVPPAIGRLVRGHLPPGVQLSGDSVVAVSSLTYENLLVARDIDAVVEPGITVLIRVQRNVSGTQEIVPVPPGVTSVLLHRINSGFVVRLQSLAPDGLLPPLGRLQALIRDPHLAAA